MEQNLNKAIDFTFNEEGIHSNDKGDPGGDTKFGVARNFHPEITDEEWENFTIEAARKIAKTYWDSCHCDDIPSPLDVIVFDTAYNMGVAKALALLKIYSEPMHYLMFRIKDYSDKVAKKPEKLRFFRGWVNRVIDLFEITNIGG
jgi:lysozyme family protein